MGHRAEEARSSELRENIISLREELNKLYLANDLLEQQRIESDEMLSICEKQRADLESKLERLHIESTDVKYQLEKSSSSNTHISGEMKELIGKLHELDAERGNLRSQVADQAADIAALKKELIAAEQLRLNVDADKLSVSEKLKVCEINREKVEMELGQVMRERGDIANQLVAMTGKKEQINEELMRLQQRLKQSLECNERLNRNVEALMKENEDKLILIESHEKEIQRQQVSRAARHCCARGHFHFTFSISCQFCVCPLFFVPPHLLAQLCVCLSRRLKSAAAAVALDSMRPGALCSLALGKRRARGHSVRREHKLGGVAKPLRAAGP